MTAQIRQGGWHREVGCRCLDPELRELLEGTRDALLDALDWAREARVELCEGRSALARARRCLEEQIAERSFAHRSPLATTEPAARDRVVGADSAVVAAQAAVDEAEGRLEELALQARTVARLLPDHEQPIGDPLAALSEMAEHLWRHVGELEWELEQGYDSIDSR